jgi:hypothetical protein
MNQQQDPNLVVAQAKTKMRYEIMSYSLFIVAWAFIIICDAVNKFSISEWILYIQLTTLVLLNLTLIAQTALTVRLMSIVSERMG